jgi:hypothetical protein
MKRCNNKKTRRALAVGGTMSNIRNRHYEKDNMGTRRELIKHGNIGNMGKVSTTYNSIPRCID